MHLDEADDLAHLLGQVEDWLRHAGGDTVDELAQLFNGPDELIDQASRRLRPACPMQRSSPANAMPEHTRT
ncbi:hypothetical protein JNW88_06985 [Micromonospora sp. ATA32]|nr:hypothetical protein [Micromonospora sp. ATA32]